MLFGLYNMDSVPTMRIVSPFSFNLSYVTASYLSPLKKGSEKIIKKKKCAK